MTSSFFRTLLTFGLFAFLGGCTSVPWGSHSSNVAHNEGPSQTSPDEAPVPKASPAEPVQAQALPGSQLGGAAAIHGKVAILLPLSGKNMALGHAMLNAAQMAVFDMSGGAFQLMPRDTGTTEATAVAAARDAVGSGAQLIIGPLFGAQVPGVRSVAEAAGISMLTLSTDTTLAAPGVFVMGFAPGPQVDRVIGFAASKGLKRFAALLPDTAYGTLVGQEFQAAVSRAGGAVVNVQTYDNLQHNIASAVAGLTQYRDRMDALFIPAGGPELDQIVAQLSAAAFDNHRIRMLGTGLWDEAGIGQRLSFLDGAWYAASDPSTRKNFTLVYERSYKQEPPRLATLAYDATALAAVLARRGERFDRSALTNPNGFSGVDGIFRLTEQGLVERGLAVDEIEAVGEQVVSPAPVTFAAQRAQ
ncbi:MAG: penicillin-binding protein activator [Pseudomonadota bacterium]|nr:penicillin-binding protein activator [Pseudomonadota bacterium]